MCLQPGCQGAEVDGGVVPTQCGGLRWVDRLALLCEIMRGARQRVEAPAPTRLLVAWQPHNCYPCAYASPLCAPLPLQFLEPCTRDGASPACCGLLATQFAPTSSWPFASCLCQPSFWEVGACSERGLVGAARMGRTGQGAAAALHSSSKCSKNMQLLCGMLAWGACRIQFLQLCTATAELAARSSSVGVLRPLAGAEDGGTVPSSRQGRGSCGGRVCGQQRGAHTAAGRRRLPGGACCSSGASCWGWVSCGDRGPSSVGAATWCTLLLRSCS